MARSGRWSGIAFFTPLEARTKLDLAVSFCDWLIFNGRHSFVEECFHVAEYRTLPLKDLYE
jgi:hypothetical protein